MTVTTRSIGVALDVGRSFPVRSQSVEHFRADARRANKLAEGFRMPRSMWHTAAGVVFADRARSRWLIPRSLRRRLTCRAAIFGDLRVAILPASNPGEIVPVVLLTVPPVTT